MEQTVQSKGSKIRCYNPLFYFKTKQLTKDGLNGYLVNFVNGFMSYQSDTVKKECNPNVRWDVNTNSQIVTDKQ